MLCFSGNSNEHVSGKLEHVCPSYKKKNKKKSSELTKWAIDRAIQWVYKIHRVMIYLWIEFACTLIDLPYIYIYILCWTRSWGDLPDFPTSNSEWSWWPEFHILAERTTCLVALVHSRKGLQLVISCLQTENTTSACQMKLYESFMPQWNYNKALLVQFVIR